MATGSRMAQAAEWLRETEWLSRQNGSGNRMAQAAEWLREQNGSGTRMAQAAEWLRETSSSRSLVLTGSKTRYSLPSHGSPASA